MHHAGSFTSGESGGQGVPSAVAPSPFNLHITALHPELKRPRPDRFNAAEPGSAFIAGGGGRDFSFNSQGPLACGAGGGSASGMHYSSSQQQLLLHSNSQAHLAAAPGPGPGALAASAGTPRATATPPPTPSSLSMRPAVNPAAVAVLTAAITRSDGIAPSAQASLLQLLGSLVSTDISGLSGDAGTTVQQPQQSGSPLKTSSGISTGRQLLAAVAAAAGGPQDTGCGPEPAAAAALAQQHQLMAKATADCGSGSFHKVAVAIMPSVGMPGPKPLPPSLAAGGRGTNSGSAQQHESGGAGTASSTAGVAGAPSTAFAAVKQDPGRLDDDEGAAAAAAAAGAACDGFPAEGDGAAPPRGRTFTRISSLREGGGSLLAPAKSLCTYKTKALAAAAGAARVGAAGSTLRLVGNICRSSSGSLVDALLSEAARAESGLLNAGLPRSDSLPDMLSMGSDESAAAAAAAVAATGDINAAVVGALRPAAASDAAAPPPAAAPTPAPPTPHAGHPAAATGAGTAAAAAAALASLTPGTAASIWNSLKDMDLPSSLISIPSLSFLSDPSDLLSLSADDLKLLQSRLEQQSVQIMQQQQQQQQLAPPPAAVDARPSLTPFQGHRSLPGRQVLTEDSLLPSWGGSRGMARLPSATRRAAAALFSHDTADAAVAEHDAAIAAAAAADGRSGTSLAAAGLRPPQLLDHSHLLGTASQQQQPQQQQQYMPRSELRVSSFEIAANLGLAALQQRQQQQQQQQHLLHPGLPSHSQGLRQMKRQDTFDVLLRQVDQELLAEAGVKQYAALQFDTLGSAAAGGGVGAAAGGLAAIPNPYAAAAAAGGPAGGMYDLSGWQQPQQQQQRAHGVFSTPNGFGGGVGGAESALQQQLAAAAAAAASVGNAATDSQEVVRYSRVITCKTYLKRLNITQPMAEHLLPYHNLSVPAAKPAAGADDDDSPRAGKPASSYEMLFKDEIAVVDTSGGRFRVQYEGVSCNSQKHLRLTSGWRDYIRAHGVEVGDTIVFERRGDERRVLYSSVIKGDGPTGGRESRAQPAAGQKRKRASRATAVQRLD